jgi:hypothetical protein
MTCVTRDGRHPEASQQLYVQSSDGVSPQRIATLPKCSRLVRTSEPHLHTRLLLIRGAVPGGARCDTESVGAGCRRGCSWRGPTQLRTPALALCGIPVACGERAVVVRIVCEGVARGPMQQMCAHRHIERCNLVLRPVRPPCTIALSSLDTCLLSSKQKQ